MSDTGAQDAATNETSTPDAGSDTGVIDAADVVVPDDVPTIVDATGGTDSGFNPGPHTPLVQVPNGGGRLLAHPQLVTVTFQGYPLRSQVEAFGDWIVGSDWITAVGTEYGVGTGNHVAKVVVAEQPPTQLTDNDIQLWIRQKIADGTLPTPPMPDNNDYFYVVYYPAATTISDSSGASCQAFGGYHNAIGVGNLVISYAVIPDCQGFDPSLDELGTITVAASHELIEAATDADPIGGGAYALQFTGSPDTTSPWVIIGGEVGDLCVGEYTLDNNYVLQRVWSNASASLDHAPCVPDDGEVYFTVSTSPESFLTARAGQTIQVPLQGWSSGPKSPWSLYAVPVVGNFTPTVTLDTTNMSNGGTATMSVRVPAGTASGSYAGIYIESYDFRMRTNIYPVAVIVP